MVKIKHKDFIGAVPGTPCLNSSWVIGLRIYGEGRTQIPLSSRATIGPLPKSRIDRVYNDTKIANNTKINHIMVSLTNYYNADSIDRVPSKTKILYSITRIMKKKRKENEKSLSCILLFFFYFKYIYQTAHCK